MKYQACSKVIINGKKRLLFQKTGSTTKYIKSKGRYVKFSAYKKALKKKSEKPKKTQKTQKTQKRQKRRGGTGKYTEKDLRNTIRIDGKLYIRDKDSPDEPLLDHIGNMKPIAVNKAILVNGRIYNIASIFNWMFEQGKMTDPFDRESIEKYKDDVELHHFRYYDTNMYGKRDKRIKKRVENQTEEEKKEELKQFEKNLKKHFDEEESDRRYYEEYYKKEPINNFIDKRRQEFNLWRYNPGVYKGYDNPDNYQWYHQHFMKKGKKQDIIDKGNKVYGPLHSITRDRERLQKFEKFNQKYGSIGKKG